MYGFTILSNKFHQLSFGRNIMVVVMGDKQHIACIVDGVIQLGRLDEFVD